MQNSTALFYLPFYIRDSSIAQKTCPRSLQNIQYNSSCSIQWTCFRLFHIVNLIFLAVHSVGHLYLSIGSLLNCTLQFWLFHVADVAREEMKAMLEEEVAFTVNQIRSHMQSAEVEGRLMDWKETECPDIENLERLHSLQVSKKLEEHIVHVLIKCKKNCMCNF